jgi:hypothetical protein
MQISKQLHAGNGFLPWCAKPAAGARLFLTMLALLAATATGAFAGDGDLLPADWQLTGTFGLSDSSGNYGTPVNTDVLLGLSTLSLASGDFKFSASIPYMRISGRGLVVFDASGNPIVINRRTSLPPDVRTGWGDVNFSASYTIPPSILDDFEVRLTGVTKVPTGSARRRLSTGAYDFGASVDVSRQFGAWGPFVTVGYLDLGKPAGFTFYNTTSVSAGTSLMLSDKLVAVASYEYDSADSPLVPAGHQLFGSLSWICNDRITLTGYGSAGLSAGSPDFGAGFLISYGLK